MWFLTAAASSSSCRCRCNHHLRCPHRRCCPPRQHCHCHHNSRTLPQRRPPPFVVVVAVVLVVGGRGGVFSGVVYSPFLVDTMMMDLSVVRIYFCVPCCAHVRLFFWWYYSTLLYFFAFSARSGQTDNQKLSPTSHLSVSRQNWIWQRENSGKKEENAGLH